MTRPDLTRLGLTRPGLTRPGLTRPGTLLPIPEAGAANNAAGRCLIAATRAASISLYSNHNNDLEEGQMPRLAVESAQSADLRHHTLRRVPLQWRRKHAPAPLQYRNAKRTAPPDCALTSC
ncbi:hypothetical protein ACFSHT_29795 [Paraburkholderia silviterrae]|uniref:hypothetical protein n=1 Tax=Paraburkholderia silviterrae TaxID=2528715 RepID=UPI00140543B3|nr:hypothetical protein [Paraburkholderia silviterrae]